MVSGSNANSSGDTYGGGATANQDLALSGSMLTIGGLNKSMLNSTSTTKVAAVKRLPQGTRAVSASRPVSNAYLRNQKLVQMRKKEQQFCYYL